MRDGRTRKVERAGADSGFDEFLRRHRVSITVVSGPARGMEYPLESERVSLGRGPGVELAFDDAAMSRQHAALEFSAGSFRIRDLGSTNGIAVNGAAATCAELDHRDRFEVGGHVFQLVVEKREPATPVYDLSGD